MARYLDESGLKIFWSKIKELVGDTSTYANKSDIGIQHLVLSTERTDGYYYYVDSETGEVFTGDTRLLWFNSYEDFFFLDDNYVQVFSTEFPFFGPTAEVDWEEGFINTAKTIRANIARIHNEASADAIVNNSYEFNLVCSRYDSSNWVDAINPNSLLAKLLLQVALDDIHVELVSTYRAWSKNLDKGIYFDELATWASPDWEEDAVYKLIFRHPWALQIEFITDYDGELVLDIYCADTNRTSISYAGRSKYQITIDKYGFFEVPSGLYVIGVETSNTDYPDIVMVLIGDRVVDLVNKYELETLYPTKADFRVHRKLETSKSTTTYDIIGTTTSEDIIVFYNYSDYAPSTLAEFFNSYAIEYDGSIKSVRITDEYQIPDDVIISLISGSTDDYYDSYEEFPASKLANMGLTDDLYIPAAIIYSNDLSLEGTTINTGEQELIGVRKSFKSAVVGVLYDGTELPQETTYITSDDLTEVVIEYNDSYTTMEVSSVKSQIPTNATRILYYPNGDATEKSIFIYSGDEIRSETIIALDERYATASGEVKVDLSEYAKTSDLDEATHNLVLKYSYDGSLPKLEITGLEPTYPLNIDSDSTEITIKLSNVITPYNHLLKSTYSIEGIEWDGSEGVNVLTKTINAGGIEYFKANGTSYKLAPELLGTSFVTIQYELPESFTSDMLKDNKVGYQELTTEDVTTHAYVISDRELVIKDGAQISVLDTTLTKNTRNGLTVTSQTANYYVYDIGEMGTESRSIYISEVGESTGSVNVDLSDYATINYVNDQISSIDTSLFRVVTELPTEDIESDKIYLIQSEITEDSNIYIEYSYINNAWEKIGEYKSDVDLSEYVKSSDLATVATSGKYSDLTGKPTIDSALSTSSTNAVLNKVITAKINALNSTIVEIADRCFYNGVTGNVALYDSTLQEIIFKSFLSLDGLSTTRYTPIGVVVESTLQPWSIGIVGLKNLTVDTVGVGTSETDFISTQMSGFLVVSISRNPTIGSDWTEAVTDTIFKDNPEYQTNESLSDVYTSIVHPILTWRFTTPGTYNGDWYVPSYSELKQLYSQKSIVASAISNINYWYGSGTAAGLSIDASGSGEYQTCYTNGYSTAFSVNLADGTNLMNPGKVILRPFLRLGNRFLSKRELKKLFGSNTTSTTTTDVDLSDVYNLIYKLHNKPTATVTPSIIKKNTETEVTLNWGLSVADSSVSGYTTKVNDTSVEETSMTESISDTKTYNVVMTYNGADYKASATVTAIYPYFWGLSTETDSTNLDTSGFTEVLKSSYAGNYSGEALTNGYFWILTTSNNVPAISSGPLEVPIIKSEDITINDATYHCYRMDESFNIDESTTYAFTIK